MKRIKLVSRMAGMTMAAMLLAGCQAVLPSSKTGSTGTVPTRPSDGQLTSVLPADETRHRIALLLPLSGQNGSVGNSIANATSMALLDTGADNIRITTYDTAMGARNAASKAIADGNKLILGPLLSSNVTNVLAVARPSRVPIISYTNDANVAAPDVFVMGQVPAQTIRRTVEYARQRGSINFASIVPNGQYGRQVEAAFRSAVTKQGGTIVGRETYERNNTSIISSAQRIRQQGQADTVLIADSANLAIRGANELKRGSGANLQLLGTELLSGEKTIRQSSAMRGLWYSAISDERYKRFSESYAERFGSNPYRISTLGYDSVLLTLRVTRNGWRAGSAFPTNQLYNDDGFLGLDGAFRFERTGVIDRAMEVREVHSDKVVIMSPAPTTFASE